MWPFCMSGHIRTCIVCYRDSGVHNLFYVVELNSEMFICVDTGVCIWWNLTLSCLSVLIRMYICMYIRM